jgi:hypothetical protein
MVPRKAFMCRKSLISLCCNMVDAPPALAWPGSDLVAADLQDVPRVLCLIRTDWRNENGRNLLTAAEFLRLLQEQSSTRVHDFCGRLKLDVLVVDVWMLGLRC